MARIDDYETGNYVYKHYPLDKMKAAVEARILVEKTCDRCGGEKRESATNEFMNHDWEDCFKHTQEHLKESQKFADDFANDLLKFGSHQYSCGGFCLCSWTLTHMGIMRYQLDRAREMEE